MQVKADTYCFGCGQDNPHGLRLKDFRTRDGIYEVDFTPAQHHQGWQDVVHGGIIATAVDEAMTRMLWEAGLTAVTAELSVRYRKPLHVGTKVVVRAWKVREASRLIEAAASVSDGETEYAAATATFVRLEGS